MQIRTILCPIDFSTLSDYELELAVEVCATFGARLVLHHNVAAAAPGLHKAWEWEGEHELEPEHKKEVTEPEARERLGALLERVPAGFRAEARVSRGPIGLVLLYLVEEISADLVILGSHGWSSEEHASLSERVIERCPCAVLTVQEGRSVGHSFRLRAAEGEPGAQVLVPTDFSDSAGRAVDYAFAMSRATPLRLHLLHVEGRGAGAAETEAAERRLWELVPPDLAVHAECHVAAGAVGDEILAKAKELDAEFIVMGEHARGLFRRYLTHDTSKELLHRARCPVWFVPPGQTRV